MKLTWYGTAAFKIETGGETVWIDPYFSRNPQARPVQLFRPEDIDAADRIFLSHGHFDHLKDVPAIVRQTAARIYCSGGAARTLQREGVPDSGIKKVTSEGFLVAGDGYTAEAFPSRHVQFDKPLVARTLLRSLFQLPTLAGLMRRYPMGQVYSWRFTIDGTTLHHFGSAGSTLEELVRLAEKKTDILLVPLQGHTDICRIALEYVRILKPRIVIPHHQDDFYPPISQQMGIGPFVSRVSGACPHTSVRVLALNETVRL